MTEYGQGSLLDASTEALVNTVNCVGIMGKGIALQFKQKYPENFKAYAKACDRGEVILGHMFVYETGKLIGPRYIVNFPTKEHWKSKSQIEDIKSGLVSLVGEIRRRGIRSIALPPLGCGNGGLAWADVRPLIERAFQPLEDVRVVVYAPGNAPRSEDMPVAERGKPLKMTRGRALLLRLMSSYRVEGDELTKIVVQKLAYLLQSAGEPMELKFVKHKFGPYAENLNHALLNMEGHFIRGFGDRDQKTDIALVDDAIRAAADLLSADAHAMHRLERVQQLITGFETPYGMELLATVHWVVSEKPELGADVEGAVAEVQQWSPWKKLKFSPPHIRIAWTRLREHGWFDLPSGTPSRQTSLDT